MTIALIAHDSKKELMVQFCTAYCRILSQHKLVATGTTGKMIAEATGLQVQRFLAGVQGGVFFGGVSQPDDRCRHGKALLLQDADGHAAAHTAAQAHQDLSLIHI